MKRVIVIRKYQTALPQFDDSMDESTGWQGWKPVQQASAQHPQHATQYLQGEYPEEFWSFEGKEASPHHGAAQHRNDDSGTYISVGVRGDAPSGDKMKVGRRHMREDMPDKRQIVVSRKSAKDVPRYQREKKRLEEKEARAKSKKSRRRPLPRGVGVFKHAESPEAKKHKKEYDTKYETTPERKKYRADLLRERRKRGLEGKGGPDMSHTARGTIVPEDPHTNRARHFKERGTLKKNLKIVKSKPVDKLAMMKMQMRDATLLLKAECMTPGKPAYDQQTANEIANHQTEMSGRPIRAYRCVGMGGKGCGMFHLTSG